MISLFVVLLSFALIFFGLFMVYNVQRNRAFKKHISGHPAPKRHLPHKP